MKNLTIIFLVFCPLIALAQLTINSTGNWSNSSIWAGGNIGDQNTEDVSMVNGVGATIQNGESYVIGDLDASNNNALTINSGGSLSLSPGSFLAAGNGTTITVNGTFTVNGNFTVQNNITLVVTGTMTVTGNFVAGNNSGIDVSGAITVQGSASVGNNSTLSGTGTFYAGGGCTGDPDVCGDPQLPLELIVFQTVSSSNGVVISWSTASETNVRHFEIEKSIDGLQFQRCGVVPAYGNSRVRQDYSLIDTEPFIGTSYYRLLEVDFDGYEKMLDIRSARFQGEKKSAVYPNPVQHHELHFTLNFIPEGKVEFAIRDLTGKVIAQGFTFEHAQSIPFNANSGVYLLSISTGNFRFTHRVRVQ